MFRKNNSSRNAKMTTSDFTNSSSIVRYMLSPSKRHVQQAIIYQPGSRAQVYLAQCIVKYRFPLPGKTLSHVYF